MAETLSGIPPEEKEEELSFEELGLEPRLVRALSKKSITKPTPIQRESIPLILEGKDVVARAKTGSGKTFSYLLPMLQKLFSEPSSQKSAPRALIFVPTTELCQQVHSEALALLEFCRVQLRVVQLTRGMQAPELTTALAGPPDVVVTTPFCISKCISEGVMKTTSFSDSLSMLVLDEADLLLSYGYEDNLKSLIPHIPRRCQCILMSATSSSDVEKLKKLVLHNPVILTLSEVANSTDEIIPKNVQQFWISCSSRDKLLYILALLKLELVQKKVLIFVNSIDMAFRLRLFLEQFGIRSAVLNAELPQNSRLHILEQFNAGLFDYLIATDDNKEKEKEETSKENNIQSRGSKKHLRQKLDAEFGVVRGIDFKNVYTVINLEMPQNPAGYVHRIGRTGRAHNTGTSVSLVSPQESVVFEEIKLLLGDDENQDASKHISPFPLLTKNAVESLRYRAEDIAKSVTKVAVKESRAQDLRNELVNSERLTAHFEHNPRDLELLKHDKLLSKKAPPVHLRNVPSYLIDPVVKEGSKHIKLSREAMGLNKSRRRPGLRSGSGKSGDPLKTFNAGKKKRTDEDGGTSLPIGLINPIANLIPGLDPLLAQASFGVSPTVYPQRPGQLECDFYMKNGQCKFGANCKFHHPTDRFAPTGSVATQAQPNIKLTLAGLPRREGTVACPFYMKTGTCKYSVACRYDHPPPGEAIAMATVQGGEKADADAAEED